MSSREKLRTRTAASLNSWHSQSVVVGERYWEHVHRVSSVRCIPRWSGWSGSEGKQREREREREKERERDWWNSARVLLLLLLLLDSSSSVTSLKAKSKRQSRRIRKYGESIFWSVTHSFILTKKHSLVWMNFKLFL